MIEPREYHALVELIANLLGFGIWLFACLRVARNVPFVVLAITHAVRVLFSIQNVRFSFGGRLIPSVNTYEEYIAYASVVSHVSSLVQIVDACALLMIVRWIYIKDIAKPRANGFLAG